MNIKHRHHEWEYIHISGGHVHVYERAYKMYAWGQKDEEKEPSHGHISLPVAYFTKASHASAHNQGHTTHKLLSTNPASVCFAIMTHTQLSSLLFSPTHKNTHNKQPQVHYDELQAGHLRKIIFTYNIIRQTSKH